VKIPPSMTLAVNALASMTLAIGALVARLGLTRWLLA